jgi:arylesterase/paraoxonase
MDNGVLAEPVDIFTSVGEDLSASSVAAEHNGKIYMGGITPRKMLVCQPG